LRFCEAAADVDAAVDAAVVGAVVGSVVAELAQPTGKAAVSMRRIRVSRIL
jgi:hypothetical protein